MKIQRFAGPMALAVVLILAMGVPTMTAQNLTVLYNFAGQPNAAYPFEGVIQDATGNLYGTASGGGTFGYGAVYKVDPNGDEHQLYSFAGGKSDGATPFSGVTQDEAGNLYGTTSEGGAYGLGVIYELDVSGQETVLYSFAGGTRDGCNPYQGLIQDKAGNLYGTTSGCGASGYGTVFRLSEAGKETVLYSFFGPPTDGESPSYGKLIGDGEGNLYGSTTSGGTVGGGLVYRLSKTGKETVLHNFAGGTTDGCFPHGTLAADKAGNLYGTTAACGATNQGIVWMLNKTGETILHNFAGGPSDGIYPFAGVIMDAQGNLYGDTEEGGTGFGTVFRLSKNRTLTLLHSFSGPDGKYPFGGVIGNAKGELYGVAEEGGSSGLYGTVWKLTR